MQQTNSPFSRRYHTFGLTYCKVPPSTPVLEASVCSSVPLQLRYPILKLQNSNGNSRIRLTVCAVREVEHEQISADGGKSVQLTITFAVPKPQTSCSNLPTTLASTVMELASTPPPLSTAECACKYRRRRESSIAVVTPWLMYMTICMDGTSICLVVCRSPCYGGENTPRKQILSHTGPQCNRLWSGM